MFVEILIYFNTKMRMAGNNSTQAQDWNYKPKLMRQVIDDLSSHYLNYIFFSISSILFSCPSIPVLSPHPSWCWLLGIVPIVKRGRWDVPQLFLLPSLLLTILFLSANLIFSPNILLSFASDSIFIYLFFVLNQSRPHSDPISRSNQLLQLNGREGGGMS